jgi:hypothetical protein
VGDYVEYTLPNVPAGTYAVKMSYKAHPNRGIAALRVDGVQVGGTVDQYSATVTYPERNFGDVMFPTTGNHVVRLTVTGKNAAAGAFTISSDKFTLAVKGGTPPPMDAGVDSAPDASPDSSPDVPRDTAPDSPRDSAPDAGVPPPLPTITVEAEALTRTSVGAATAPQTDVNSSGGTWIALQADGVGDYVDYTIPNVPAGTYQLKMKYKAHPNRGILNMLVNGVALGGTVDQYSATALYPEPLFGTVTFATTGNQVVRLIVAGKNPAAGTFTLSADRFVLTP